MQELEDPSYFLLGPAILWLPVFLKSQSWQMDGQENIWKRHHRCLTTWAQRDMYHFCSHSVSWPRCTASLTGREAGECISVRSQSLCRSKQNHVIPVKNRLLKETEIDHKGGSCLWVTWVYMGKKDKVGHSSRRASHALVTTSCFSYQGCFPLSRISFFPASS